MTFLNPILLSVGLGCIAIPIIVHLLTRHRRKPIQWAAMKFLLEAYKKHRRRLTLEQLLLLACRCLLVALIGLALGKPVLGAAGLLGRRGPRTLYLLVDNSLAASATDAAGSPALARHKAKATELLGTLDQSRGDRAALLTLGGPAQAIVLPPSNDLPSVERLVQAVQTTSSRGDLAGAAERVKEDLAPSQAATPDAGSVSVAVLSEFLAGSAEVDRPLPSVVSGSPDAPKISVGATRPAETGADNISIVRVEPQRGILLAGESDAPADAGSNQVRVTLARNGPGVGAPAVSVVRVRADEGPTPGPAARAEVRWSPGQAEASVTVTVALPSRQGTSKSVTITAEIDRDAVHADDVARRPMESRRSLQIGISGPPSTGGLSGVQSFSGADWLRAALRPERADARETVAPTGLRLIDLDPRTLAQPGVLAGLDAVLLTSPEQLDPLGWSRLAEFTNAGGLLTVFPPSDATVHLWADAFLKAFGLDWTIAREPQTLAAPATLADPGTPVHPLLAVLAGELADLQRPTRVFRVLRVSAEPRSAERVMTLSDGTPLVLAAPNTGRGALIVFAAALDPRWTDIPTKPLMLPLMQELVRQGVGRSAGAWASIAGTVPSVPTGTRELRRLDDEGAGTPSGVPDSLVVVPATAPPGSAGEAMRYSGLWSAVDARGATLGAVAVNADPSAGRSAPRSAGEVQRWLGGLAGEDRVRWLPSSSDAPDSSGQPAASFGEDERAPFSTPLLLGAAALAIAELILARAVSHARADGPSSIPLAPRAAEKAA